MGTNVWGTLHNGYDIYEWHHGSAILANDFPQEFQEIGDVLSGFQLLRSDIVAPGGNKGPIAVKLDLAFTARGWRERGFRTQIAVDGHAIEVPTHKVDCYKNGVAFEIEWNNKDPFFDRDLNNFRLLFELRVVSVGVILTRCSQLQQLFDSLGKGPSYGPSTTHIDKLMPRIHGGGAGGCPLVVFGISDRLYVNN